MEYMKISIPKILADRIKRILKDIGYRSVSEFVIDATRRRLDEITRDSKQVFSRRGDFPKENIEEVAVEDA